MAKCARCGRTSAPNVLVQNYLIKSGGKEIQVTLCTSCHRILYPVGRDTFFSSLVGEDAAKTCGACGTSLADFRASGLLGCANCYEVFRDDLIPTIQYLHGKVYHKGEALNVDEEKYDRIRALAEEQEAVRRRLQSAKKRGDGVEIEKLTARLSELGRALSGGEK